MNLLYIARVNRLTEKIISLRSELKRRQGQPPHPRVGAWRHQYNIDHLRFKAEMLEKKRLALLSVAPKRMRGFVETKPLKSESLAEVLDSGSEPKLKT